MELELVLKLVDLMAERQLQSIEHRQKHLKKSVETNLAEMRLKEVENC